MLLIQGTESTHPINHLVAIVQTLRTKVCYKIHTSFIFHFTDSENFHILNLNKVTNNLEGRISIDNHGMSYSEFEIFNLKEVIDNIVNLGQ